MTRRRVWLAIIGLLLVVAAVVIGSSVRRVLAKQRRQAAAEAWTTSRRHAFRRGCVDEAKRPLPPQVVSGGLGGDYCTCVTDRLAEAIPSFPQAVRAADAVGKPGGDTDVQKAAEIFERCAAERR